MSRKSIQTLAIMSAFVLGAFGAVACGDDEKKDDKKDAGTGGDGDGDGDGDKPGDGDGDGDELPAGAAKCGDQVCTKLVLSSGDVNACCTEDADGKPACGLESTNLAGEGKPACVLRDAPGVKSESCGAIWDLIDSEAEGDGGATDGKYTTVRETALGAATLQFDGCCTPAGACSIDFKDPAVKLGTTNVGPTDLGYGCADPAHVGLNLGSQALGLGDTISCDPKTGMATEAPQAPGGDGDAGADDAGAGDSGA